jgi:hypothetical protein
MGKAYGAPLAWSGDRFDFDEAERKARGGCSGDVLWRVESVSYSYIVDAETDHYGSTDPRLELFSVRVIRWTPAGATVAEPAGVRDKWVDLRDGAHQWASRTPAEALDQFKARRERQLWVLRRQIQRAKQDLTLCTPVPFLAPCP